jgi:hypothetical protein
VMPAVSAFNTFSNRTSMSTDFRVPPWSGRCRVDARA